MIVAFSKVLVMIHSEMWSDSDKYLERSVSGFSDRLYIRYERKREESGTKNWIIVVPFSEMGIIEARAGLKKKFKRLDSDMYA